MIKGGKIIKHIRDFQVKGCESWVDLVKYIIRQLRGKVVVDIPIYEELKKNDELLIKAIIKANEFEGKLWKLIKKYPKGISYSVGWKQKDEWFEELKELVEFDD